MQWSLKGIGPTTKQRIPPCRSAGSLPRFLGESAAAERFPHHPPTQIHSPCSPSHLGSLSPTNFVLLLGRVHAVVVRKRGLGTPAMEFPLPQSVSPFPYISLSQTAERLTFHPSIAWKTLENITFPPKTTSLGPFSAPIAANFSSRRTSPWALSRRCSPPSRYSQHCQE